MRRYRLAWCATAVTDRPIVDEHVWPIGHLAGRIRLVSRGATRYRPRMTDAADAALAAQYEAYPYPARDPREEAKRLIVGSPSHLLEVDHWIFGARRSRATPLRALIAGGGTGDAAVMLAQQLATAGRDGEVVWLDRSRAARRIVEARAAARSLGNLRCIEGSLLDLPEVAPGPFDYIDCCGVLHHLPDPAAGLRALLSVLAPGGGIGLMVYAPHGRTGVYMLQDALRILAPADEAPAVRVDVARRLWRGAPETAWLKRNPWLTDHLTGGDAGLYDLLLNPRDVAFTVPALAALLAGEGLAVTCLVEPTRYDPDTWIADPRLRARLASLDSVRRAAVAEAVCGNMGIHIAYVRRAAEPLPAPPWDDPAAIPVLREMDGPSLARGLPPDGTLPVAFDGLRVPVALPRLAAAILGRIDGRACVGEIADAVAASGISREVFSRDFAALSRAMQGLNRMLLAAPVNGPP